MDSPGSVHCTTEPGHGGDEGGRETSVRDNPDMGDMEQGRGLGEGSPQIGF